VTGLSAGWSGTCRPGMSGSESSESPGKHGTAQFDEADDW